MKPKASELDKLLADFQLFNRMHNQVGNKGWEDSCKQLAADIKQLFLGLIGEDEPLPRSQGLLHRVQSRNDLRAVLRHEVEDL